MTGSFARSLERPQTIANFAFNIEKYGLPKDYYETYLQKLNAVTAADVQAMAKKVIKPNNAYITVVGNKEIIGNLKVFAASGKVDVYNPDGTPFSEMRPAPAGVTTSSVLEGYITAIGGKEKLSAVKSFDQKGKFMMQGMALDMSTKMKDNSKLTMSVKMGEMEVMKQVYDGKSGYQSQMGQKVEMTADELKESKQQIDMMIELHYADYGMTAELKGVDAIDGQDVYVLEVKESNGDISTDYYSVATGLKLRSISVSQREGQTITTETSFSEYKEFGGIKVPTKIQQTTGGQSLEMLTDSYDINVKLDDSLFK